MVALQEECDWVTYVIVGLADDSLLARPDQYSDMSCPRGDRPFERIKPRQATVRAKKQALPLREAEAPPVGALPSYLEPLWNRRVEAIKASEMLSVLETPLFKRYWRDTEQNITERKYRSQKDRADLETWLADRVEDWARTRSQPFTIGNAASAMQADVPVLTVCEVLAGRRDFSIETVLGEMLAGESVPSNLNHVYTSDGLLVRAAWDEMWESQRQEDTGADVVPDALPPVYSQGSRGKSTHFVRPEYWKIRGSLDVPKERFTAFTEIPGREGSDTLFGWAGWTAMQKLKALLVIDEDLEDSGVPLADRIGVLDSAWRLLPDVAREDATAAGRLKAELQALVGPEGPSTELIEEWRKRFPPPTARGKRGRKAR